MYRDKTDEKIFTMSGVDAIELPLSKEQIANITESVLFSTISTSTVEVLVEISNYDLNNKSTYLAQVELEAKKQAEEILSDGINNENLNH